MVRILELPSLFCVSFLLLLILCPYVTTTSTKCPQGTHLYKLMPERCVQCPVGTFMPYKDHQHTECRLCEKIEDTNLEYEESPCNKTHDADIRCVDGYYRDQARNPRETGTCRKCTDCSGHNMYTGQACGTYRDSVCCFDENFDVALNHHGVPLCRERPWFCRQGQYFDTRGFQCLPCPNNTFMPVDFHVRPKCISCTEYTTFEANSPLHSVIIQQCDGKQDTILKCKHGFYIKSTMGYRNDSIGCSPCTNCSTTDAQYEGRKCDNIRDSVCCPQPDMTIVDTPRGPVCCPHPNMTIVDTPRGPVCCPHPNMTIVDTHRGPVCCSHPNMTIVDTPRGPVCCPHPNMTIVDTPRGPVCCPQPHMIVVDTSGGPMCKTAVSEKDLEVIVYKGTADKNGKGPDTNDADDKEDPDGEADNGQNRRSRACHQKCSIYTVVALIIISVVALKLQCRAVQQRN